MSKLFTTPYLQAISIYRQQNGIQGMFCPKKGSPEYMSVIQISDKIKSGEIPAQLKPRAPRKKKIQAPADVSPMAASTKSTDLSLNRKTPDLQPNPVSNTAPPPNALPIETTPAAPPVETQSEGLTDAEFEELDRLTFNSQTCRDLIHLINFMKKNKIR